MMCGGMGGMGGMGFGQGQSFGQLLAALLSFLGQLASQVLVILTSGPVLGLVVARLTFRALVPWPRAAERTPRILEWAGSLTHWSLYALMVLIPLTGWIVASSAGCCIGVPGLPDINQFSMGTGGTAPADPAVAYSLHRVLPWALLALILVHVAASLFHHFIARDETLTRMLPGPPRRRRRPVEPDRSNGPMAERQSEGGQT